MYYVPLPFLSQLIANCTSLNIPLDFIVCSFLLGILWKIEKWAVPGFFIQFVCSLQIPDAAFMLLKHRPIDKNWIYGPCVSILCASFTYFIHLSVLLYCVEVFAVIISESISMILTVLPLIQCRVICIIIDSSNLVLKAWRNTSRNFWPLLAPFISEGASLCEFHLAGTDLWRALCRDSFTRVAFR